MEAQYIPAIFESGKLCPLTPLDLHEHERVEVAILRSEATVEASDEDYVPNIVQEADSSVTLEQVQAALAGIPGSLVEDFAREREERF
jgi:predicted DNA-binding antitoxin AbrB/MazE fold protein